MLFVTRWFGVTGSDADRDPAREQADLNELVERVLLLQSNAATQQHRPLRRGTHAKGVCARAQFEVFDVSPGRDAKLAARLAKGVFAKPGVYPAVVRFGNADPKINSDFKPDVRSLSFSVDLTRNGRPTIESNGSRQDFSLQNAPPLPINDTAAFLATMKLLTASNPAVGLLKLPFKDKLRVLRVLALAQLQSRQRIQPYQQLRYWSNVPFRHGLADVVMQSARPSPDNRAHPLRHSNPNGLKDELIRHLDEDSKMSSSTLNSSFSMLNERLIGASATTRISGLKMLAPNGRKQRHLFTRLDALPSSRNRNSTRKRRNRSTSMSQAMQHQRARRLEVSIARACMEKAPVEKHGCTGATDNRNACETVCGWAPGTSGPAVNASLNL